MESADLQQLQSHVEATNNWKVQSIPVQCIVDVSLPPAEWSSRTINLADHIVWRSQGSHQKGNRIYLADFNADSAEYRRDRLLPTLRKACRPEGFELIQRAYTNSTLILECSRGKMHTPKKAPITDKPKESRKAPKTTTNRPIVTSDRCKFRVTLFWDKELHLWYFDEFATGNLEHNGHCRRDEREVKVSTLDIGEEDKQIAAELDKVHASSNTAQALLEERTGVLLTPGQMQHLRVKSRGEELRDQGIDEKASAAEKALHYLENVDKTASYVALFADFDSDMLRIPRLSQVKRYRGGTRVESSEIPVTEANSFWHEVAPVNESLHDEADSAQAQASVTPFAPPLQCVRTATAPPLQCAAQFARPLQRCANSRRRCANSRRLCNVLRQFMPPLKRRSRRLCNAVRAASVTPFAPPLQCVRTATAPPLQCAAQFARPLQRCANSRRRCANSRRLCNVLRQFMPPLKHVRAASVTPFTPPLQCARAASATRLGRKWRCAIRASANSSSVDC